MKSSVRPASGRAAGQRLERAYAGRPDRQHALGGLDPPPGGRAHLVALAVQAVPIEVVHGHRAEGVEPDVQGDPLDVEALEQLGREVEPGRRRGGRARLARENRLIALRVVELLVDVGRQAAPRPRGSPSSAIRQRPSPERLEQLDRPQPLPGAELAGRTRERLPLPAAERLEQEHLHLAAGRLAQPQSRRHDAGVVDHHQLAVQLLGELAEAALADLSARPLEDEQPRLVAAVERPLRDQLPRELVVQVA